MPDQIELLFQTLHREIGSMREEAKDRHIENQKRLDRIDDRLVSLERWRSFLVGAWGTVLALGAAAWAIAKEWRR